MAKRKKPKKPCRLAALLLLPLTACNLPKLDQVSEKTQETAGVVAQIGQAVQRQIDVVRSADTNKDGKVSWSEVLAMLAGTGGLAGAYSASRKSSLAQSHVDDLYDATATTRAVKLA
jgi:hypothetical protein